ncbi:MAG: hypothetical protein ACTSRC_18425 [Candidatus Helarchaeota archaeon]
MLGTKKVKIIKLNSNGHTAVEVAQATALGLVGQCLDEGQFAFCEPDKIVVSQRSELQGRRLEKVIIFAPVVGG